jgi:serine/threonine-protein kinase RsbW
MEAVEELCVSLRALLESRLTRNDLFAAELLAREALCNAVDHGCDFDAAQSIRFEARMDGQAITIVVQHNGAGFDWNAVRATPAGDLDESGRGLMILERYATRFRYTAGGRKIEIHRTLEEEGNL